MAVAEAEVVGDSEVEVESEVEAEADVEVEAEAEVVMSFALFSPQRGVCGGSNSRADRSVRLSFRFDRRGPRVTALPCLSNVRRR